MRRGENDNDPSYSGISLTILVLCFLFYFISIYSGSGIYLSSANAKSTSPIGSQIKKCDVTQSNTTIDNINTYELNIMGETYPINYQITGAKLNNIFASSIQTSTL